MKRCLEICLDTVEAAITASNAGAHRLEVCSALTEGGLTPSYGMVKTIQARTNVDLAVLIRPRSGDFLYTNSEFSVMREDILHLKSCGINAVVFGVLNKNGTLDIYRNEELIDLAKPMDSVLHRAFDMVKDPFRTLEECVDIGFKRILTSGQKNSAYYGLDLICTLIEKANGRITVMPGAGIDESNVSDFLRVGATDIHTTLKKVVKSKMEYRNNDLSMGTQDFEKEYLISSTNSEKIKQVLKLLESN